MERSSWSALAHWPRISRPMLWYVLTVAGSAVYLYLNLFASFGVPYLLGGDQMYFWMGAQRLLHEQTIYRDFFQYTPPGADLVFEACFKMLGSSVWVANAVIMCLGVALASVCFSLSCQMMRVRVAALTTGLFLIGIYGKLLNATHHWFAVLLILIAVRVSMLRVTYKRIAVSGALIGLAAFFNHVHGAAALLGFMVFLLLRHTRTGDEPAKTARMLAVLVLACVLVVLFLGMYYLATVGPERIWYCLVASVLRYTAGSYSRTLGLVPPAGSSRAATMLLKLYLAAYISLPVIYCISLHQCWRSRKISAFPWNQVALLSLVGLAFLLEVTISFNWLRLFAVALPGIVLLGRAASDLLSRRHSALILASLALCSVAGRQIVVKPILASVRIEVPGGRVAITPRAYEKLHWLTAHTQPGEFFLQAGWPGLYLPLGVQSPIYMPSLTRWDAFHDQDVEPAVKQMKTHQVRYVLWTPMLDKDCKSTPCEDYLSPFRTYLNSSYTRVRTFEDGDVVWQKIEDVPAL